MKKIETKQTKTARPFALEFLESIPETELKSITGALPDGGVHTEYISLFPRPDRG
jgi:hypothetical protein